MIRSLRFLNRAPLSSIAQLHAPPPIQIVRVIPAAPAPPEVEFYRRVLPPPAVAFASEEGQRRLVRALSNGTAKCFFKLIEQFRTQDDPAFCGLTTLVVILNAMAVDPRKRWKGPWRWYQESFLDCCAPLEQVQTSGITIDTVACLARCNGLHAHVQRPAPEGGDETAGDFTEEQFRASVLEHMERDDAFLVTAYTRQALGQTGTGHFSPLAAYDPETDSVLVLDVARFKYPPHWVPLHDMFDAMRALDPATSKPRGLIRFSRMAAAPLLLFQLEASACALKDDVVPEEGSRRCCGTNLSPRCGPAALRDAVRSIVTKVQGDTAVSDPAALVRSFARAYATAMSCCGAGRDGNGDVISLVGPRLWTKGTVNKVGAEHAAAARDLLVALGDSVVYRRVREALRETAAGELLKGEEVIAVEEEGEGEEPEDGAGGDAVVDPATGAATPTRKWQDTASSVRVRGADLLTMLLFALALPPELRLPDPASPVRTECKVCGGGGAERAGRGGTVCSSALWHLFEPLWPWVREALDGAEGVREGGHDKGTRLLLNEAQMLNKQLAELLPENTETVC